MVANAPLRLYALRLPSNFFSLGNGMTTKDKSPGVNRREFLSSATAGVAAAALTKPAAAQQGGEEAGAQFAAITPPSAAAEAMEFDVPGGYSAVEARE